MLAACLLTFCVAGFAQVQTISSNQALDALRNDLERTQEIRLSLALEPEAYIKNNQHELEIKHAFERLGNTAIDYLGKELDHLNRAELDRMKSPDDIEGAFNGGKPTESLMRYAICYILADMYGSTDPRRKDLILQRIVKSFVPTTDGNDDRGTLSGSLVRIGKDGIRGFLMLAQSERQTNRCYAVRVLHDVDKNAPPMSCNAKRTIRQRQIAAYEAWWKTHGAEVKWPDVPSYFDLPVPRQN